MEGLVVNPNHWLGRTVLITGHTGFKGSWLALWLARLGAKVVGVALEPETRPSLFIDAGIPEIVTSYIHDIRDDLFLTEISQRHEVDTVFHLAAQALVLASYEKPIESFAVNAIGTAAVLEAVRKTPSVTACVVVTTDKCYENTNNGWPFREDDRLGGHDPYSASKACAEIIASAYRRSFPDSSCASVATARAGNVIGGGDWAADRLVPDIVRAYKHGTGISIRAPESVRPWQHVLEPLHGYMLLAKALSAGSKDIATSWNFGPDPSNQKSVAWMAAEFVSAWGQRISVSQGTPREHEAHYLTLDSTLARLNLHWKPMLDAKTTVDWAAQWYREYLGGSNAYDLCIDNIKAYERLLNDDK